MKVLREGHKYFLENFEQETKSISGEDIPWIAVGQEIQFIEKVPVEQLENIPVEAEKGILVTLFNGTTNEEVLAVLIDRLNYLQGKFPCKENAVAITHIETALLWLNKRTEDRKKRGVEGKQVK